MNSLSLFVPSAETMNLNTREDYVWLDEQMLTRPVSPSWEQLLTDTPVSGSLSVFILSSDVADFARPPPSPSTPHWDPFLLLPGQINSVPLPPAQRCCPWWTANISLFCPMTDMNSVPTLVLPSRGSFRRSAQDDNKVASTTSQRWPCMPSHSLHRVEAGQLLCRTTSPPLWCGDFSVSIVFSRSGWMNEVVPLGVILLPHVLPWKNDDPFL